MAEKDRPREEEQRLSQAEPEITAPQTGKIGNQGKEPKIKPKEVGRKETLKEDKKSYQEEK